MLCRWTSREVGTLTVLSPIDMVRDSNTFGMNMSLEIWAQRLGVLEKLSMSVRVVADQLLDVGNAG